ncbi:MAG: NAD(P)H-hydrate epimerase [Phycisphaerales bacterium]|nr:NAD(P)H-hydrate epimerase [Phycisphaerales bacterium]
MNPIRLTREEVRDLDMFTTEALGIPAAVLMENAGRQAAEAIASLFARKDGAPPEMVAIVTGGGNNGGDGHVIARHLSNWGVEAVTFLVADPQNVTGDALMNLHANLAMDMPVYTLSPEWADDLSDELAKFDVVIDAIGGTGMTGELRKETAEVVNQINACGKPVVAIDIPTGLDCDTGEPLENSPAVYAKFTITFVAEKQGFADNASQAYTGNVIVADIGINATRVLDIMAQAAEEARADLDLPAAEEPEE